jgi:hypothetical protein
VVFRNLPNTFLKSSFSAPSDVLGVCLGFKPARKSFLGGVSGLDLVLVTGVLAEPRLIALAPSVTLLLAVAEFCEVL